jgi:hypothetical protein
LQAKQAVKIKLEIDKKSSSANLIFPNCFFRNQVQINRGIETYVLAFLTHIILAIHRWCNLPFSQFGIFPEDRARTGSTISSAVLYKMDCSTGWGVSKFGRTFSNLGTFCQ